VGSKTLPPACLLLPASCLLYSVSYMSGPPAIPVVLSIAGFDPSSGAGVTADIKTIAAHGCYGVACVTSLTVQSTQGVSRVESVSPELVTKILLALSSDVSIAAVRVGMLGTADVTRAVGAFLEAHRPPHVVLDPVLRASSGMALLEEEGIAVLKDRLLPLATVATPNIHEASILTGLEVVSLKDMKAAASKVHALGCRNVVVTGGHLESPVDLLSAENGKAQQEFPGERFDVGATHGTGCAFATSLACNLALGKGLASAVGLAKSYVAAAMADPCRPGKGAATLNHLFRLGVGKT